MSTKQKKKSKVEINQLADTTQRLSEHRKTIELKNGDRIEIRYIPCPPEKIIAWNRSMELITKMILEILEEPVDHNFPICPECQCELHLTIDGEHVCRNEACSKYR